MTSPQSNRVATIADFMHHSTASCAHQPSLSIVESSHGNIQAAKSNNNNERRVSRSATGKKTSLHHLHHAKTAHSAAAAAAHHYAKNKKAFRILCLVTCSLIFFWMPWIVAWPVQAYCQCLPRFAYALTYWLEYLNSLINSVILIVFNQNFRKKFLSLFFNFGK